MKEEWKTIKDFENYKISSFGRVLSLNKNSIMTPQLNSTGYLFVRLSKKGKKTVFFIHRLVALHFIKNPLGKEQVNHKDENKLNNKIDNLEWVTVKENNNYGTRTVRAAKATGKAILAFDKDTNEEIGRYDSQSAAARSLGLSHQNIGKVVNGERNHTGGYYFKIINKGE